MKVNSYRYKPEAVFYGESDYHFGLELECLVPNGACPRVSRERSFD
jgi:hypothetical protein